MQVDAKEENKKKAFVGVVRRREVHRRQKSSKKNCRDSVKECVLMLSKQEKCKRTELKISLRKRHRHFEDDGRRAENVLLQASAKMSENKINGP